MNDVMLKVEPATPASIAPFGSLIRAVGSNYRPSTFYGGAVEMHEAPEFASDSDTAFTLARIKAREPEVRFLERHFKHTQAFVPLNAQRYVVVLGEPGDSLPAVGRLRALRFEGNCGLLMHVGTWHEFPFALDIPVEMLVVLRHETNRNLEAFENGEAIGGDLEKRNAPMRLSERVRWVP